jgi:hypothetical protein
MGPKGTQEVRLLLDTGAESSFIRRNIAEELQLKKKQDTFMNICGIAGQTKTMKIDIVECILSSVVSEHHVQCELQILDIICADLPGLAVTRQDLPDLDEEQLTEELPIPPSPVDILVGHDLFVRLFPPNAVLRMQNDVWLWPTYFGLALSGGPTRSYVSAPTQSAFVNNVSHGHETSECASILHKFWDLETLGIKSGESVISPPEAYALQHFSQNVRFTGERYSVGLPFKQPLREPKNNRSVATKLFFSLERRLLKQPAFRLNEYIEAFEDFITQGHVELCDPTVDGAYYMPHHAVIKDEHPSTKVRIVMNASSPDEDGYSLNDALEQGPALQRDLLNVFTLFRRAAVALTADVKKMFRMIEVHPEHRDYLRLLWRRPGTNEPLKTYRMTRLPFGLNCSPFLAIQTMLFHFTTFQVQFPVASSLLQTNMYVDDCLLSVDDVMDAVVLRKNISQIAESGGFQFAKWLSNSRVVMNSIPEQEKRPVEFVPLADKADSSFSADPIIKTLGIAWNPRDDVFQFTGVFDVTLPNDVETMRTLCSRAAKLYDPPGFVSCVAITAKILLQQCWTAKLKWDDPLPEHIRAPWEKWINDLIYLHYIQIPRSLICSQANEIQIHGFADASNVAAAAVVYVRSIDNKGKVFVRFAASKTRVAPLKSITIPRFELVAALLCAKLTKNVATLLRIDDVVLWTDNSATFHWLQKSPSNWKTFVGNRVAQIQELFPDAKTWRYCPTELNPADKASRGLSALQVLQDQTWFAGPEFLSRSQKAWPDNLLPAVNPDISVEERKIVLVQQMKTNDLLTTIFIALRPFSMAINILRRILQFCSKCRRSKKIVTNDCAMRTFVRMIQSQYFPTEIDALTKGTSISKTSKLNQICPVMDPETGLMLVGGRLAHAEFLPEEERMPSILPSKAKEVEKLVMFIHVTWGHIGPEMTLFKLRKKYWLVGGRREVKRIISRCKCYRLRAKPFAQKMAPLPDFKTRLVSAFDVTGVDFFGPIQLTFSKKHPVELKIFGVIFSCMSTRACHLEVVFDATTSEFIYAVKRFMAEKGYCRKFVSDNAKQFMKANRQLQIMYKSLDYKLIERENLHLPEPIEWQFNAPLAPWWGGSFERQIGAIKKTLRATMANRKCHLSEFLTLLKQAEAVVNSRPLTVLSEDINDPLPITPAHLLWGRSLEAIPDILAKNIAENPIDVQWRKRARLHLEFRTRWKNEYLKALQPRQKWLHEGHEPKVGEIVLIRDDGKNKMLWKLGRVEEIHRGRDGLVRSVDLHLGSGNRFKRPIQALYRLEAQEAINNGPQPNDPSMDN